MKGKSPMSATGVSNTFLWSLLVASFLTYHNAVRKPLWIGQEHFRIVQQIQATITKVFLLGSLRNKNKNKTTKKKVVNIPSLSHTKIHLDTSLTLVAYRARTSLVPKVLVMFLRVRSSCCRYARRVLNTDECWPPSESMTRIIVLCMYKGDQNIIFLQG